MRKRFLIDSKSLFYRDLFFSIFFVFFPFFCFSNEQNRDSLTVVNYYQKGKSAFRMGDFEGAVIHYEDALTLGAKVFDNLSFNLFSSCINLGIAYKNLGEYDKAINVYLKAEEIIIKNFGTDNPRLSFVYGNLGNIYKLKGDYVKSYDYQQATLRAFLLDSKRYRTQISITRSNIAEALYLLGEYEEAILSAFDALEDSSDNVKSFLYSLIARIYFQQSNYPETRKYYGESLSILTKAYGADSYDLGLEYINYSQLLLKIGDYDEAYRYTELAEDIIVKYFTKKSLQYSDIMLNYANYYLGRSSAASDLTDFYEKRKADLKKALGYYQEALIAGSDVFSSVSFNDNPKPGEEISEIQMLEVINQKAGCLEALADLYLSGQDKTNAKESFELALRTTERATELIHQIRTGYVSEESQFFLSENQESTFIRAVGVCYKLYDLTDEFQFAEKGFRFAEKSKSASFLASVKDSRAKKFGGIPDSLLKREDYLKTNISNYKEMLFEENQNEDPDSARIELFNSKVFQLSEQYEQLVKVFEESFPNYYAFKYENKVVGVDQIQERISDRTAVIEYLIEEPTAQKAKGQVFKFVITPDELHFSKEVVDSTFVGSIESVYQFLTSSKYLFTGKGEYRKYALAAHELYNVLLSDEKQVLEDKDLVVIPDDKLAYLPFDALLSAPPDTTTMNFRTLPYLVKDYSISYTYSATLLYDYFNKEKVAKHDLLAFAPSYEGDDRDYTANAEYRGGLLPLPAVNKEVDFIHGYVNGDVFKDSLAQESRFKELASDYDILHLAMHTIINDTLPMYSKLAFSKPYGAQMDDGWLNTNEIYSMDLNARMAVLSACNTGSGKLQKGEGVMSLARGFLYAGCPSIVMTLWEVEDESGAHIMKDFYKFLSKGKSKHEALRSAKLAHIANADPLKAHPHYWLGYVVVGNSDPLYKGKDIYFILIIFGVVVLLFVDQLYRKRKEKARD